MKKEIEVKKVGEILVSLAEMLTVEDFEVTPDEILEGIEGNCLAPEEAARISEWLNT